MVSRLLAVLVAAGLIVGALATRDGMDTPGLPGADPTGTVVCATELRQVCDDLAGEDLTVRVQDAGVSLDELATDDPPAVEAWLTLRPWPQMVRDRREQAGLDVLLGDDSATLAVSPLVLAVWDDRAEILTGACDPVSWRCVGDVAGGTWADIGGPDTWGAVKPGHADPARSAGGLLALHQATADRLGTTEYTRRDLDDRAFFGWFTTLQDAVPDFRPPSGSPLLAMAQVGPAAFDVVGAVEAEVLALRERAAERVGRLQVLPGGPAVTAEVVVVAVGPDTRVAERVADAAPELLAARRWDTQDGQTAQAVPSPGALEALRATWSEVMG